MQIDKLDLLKKGWTTAEIEHASKIIEDAENKKHIGIRFLDKSVFGALLFLLIIINVVCAIVLLPFLFSLKGGFVNIVVAVVGFIFGVLFMILIAGIERFNRQHHRTLITVFLVSGIIGFAIIIKFVQDFSSRIKLPIIHDPYVLGGTYFVAFLVPYIMYLISEEDRK